MTAEMKQCPFCKEPIQAKALVCRYCTRDVSKYKNVPVPGPDDIAEKANRWATIGPIVAVVCLIVFLLYYGVRIYNGW